VAETHGGGAWFGSAELVLAALTGAALIRRSNAQPRPLVPIDLLKNKLFAMSGVTSIASLSAQMPAFVSLPPTLDQAGQEIPASSAARLAGVAGRRIKLSRRFPADRSLR
jgi:hypothetical protein